MKSRRDRTVWPKFKDDNGKHEAALASADSLSDKGDTTLVAAAKDENRQAFEILVERHARRVFFAARRITRTREDAEDIVQQSLQKAFIHLSQFEGKSSFSTWLTRIAINEALILLRKRRRLNETSMNDSAESEDALFALEIPDSRPNPEDSYSQQEWQHILFSAMKRLPHGTRRAFQLRELDERSTEETARIMGISVNAVKARLFHGRKKLRERLQRFVEPSWTSGSTRPISQDHAACNPCA